jgi:hypothetical protein
MRVNEVVGFSWTRLRASYGGFHGSSCDFGKTIGGFWPMEL